MKTSEKLFKLAEKLENSNRTKTADNAGKKLLNEITIKLLNEITIRKNDFNDERLWNYLCNSANVIGRDNIEYITIAKGSKVTVKWN